MKRPLSAVPEAAGHDAPTAGERRRRMSPRRWPFLTVEAGFRWLAALRRAPALHPRGLTCAATLEVVRDRGEPWGVPWLDTAGRYAALVRLSRAAGLPGRLPDGLGLAVRVASAGGPDRPVDLLLTSSGRGRVLRHLPVPRVDALGGPYSSLLPYRVAGRRGVLAAFPRRTAQAPVPGNPTALADALDGGPLVFDLCAAVSGGWRTFAVLTVTAPLAAQPQESVGFDIYAHSAEQFRPGGALAATRRAAYTGSRTGRARAGRRAGDLDG
ncbi:phosphodiesterase [Streptomyces sp. JB150]|uniref:phosphodiesterase n=1 Tax=Streptomyces sp. JB150 TaxID=2714844 RepID=UPI00140A5244|nr:phosphodiesterase [Streptomyces sp. JB150]QIJ66009.1 phosphodiesterase [Streptomyces sp. JB150]